MVIDDQAVVRQGFVALINTVADMEVIAEGINGQQAIDLYRQHKPDVTLIDLRMPVVGGVEAIGTIRREFPEARQEWQRYFKLKKDPRILEAAYNDTLGVTSAFVRNQLARINHELDADFDVRQFKLVSIYNGAEGRVEVYLESSRAQTVPVRKLEMQIALEAGERIHMEHSYKYDLVQLSSMAAGSGFERARTWMDSREYFSSNLFLAV